MAPRTDISLDIDKVVKAAFDVLEQEGIEKLTMRRLAAELSVKPPALYWHFKDKAELLSLMGHSIYRSAVAAVQPAGSARDWLVEFGLALHAILTAHRDAARVFAVARPTTAMVTGLEPTALVAPLLAFGLGQEEAFNRLSSVICLAVGWSTFNDNPAMQAMLGKMMDLEASFDLGLRSLVKGYPEASPAESSVVV